MISQNAHRAAKNAFGTSYDSWLEQVQQYPHSASLDRIYGACDMLQHGSDDEAFLYWIIDAFHGCVKRYWEARHAD